MKITYRPQGVCSVQIDAVVEDGFVKSVTFTGGCNGNTQGLARLAAGRKVEDVIAALEGIRCGFRPTSCPDQLAQALRQAISSNDAGQSNE